MNRQRFSSIRWNSVTKIHSCKTETTCEWFWSRGKLIGVWRTFLAGGRSIGREGKGKVERRHETFIGNRLVNRPQLWTTRIPDARKGYLRPAESIRYPVLEISRNKVVSVPEMSREPNANLARWHVSRCHLRNAARSIDRANRASHIHHPRGKKGRSFAPRPLFIPSKNRKIHRTTRLKPFFHSTHPSLNLLLRNYIFVVCVFFLTS